MQGSSVAYPHGKHDIDLLVRLHRLLFLANLSRRLIGELIVYKGIRRPSTFSNDISSKAEKPILFIFHI